jgi:hypothetical protein
VPPLKSSRSLLTFFRGEVLLDEPEDDGQSGNAQNHHPSLLVYNFLVLPWFLERLLTLGCLICADCFLHLFTVLPLRCAVALASLAKYVLCGCGMFRRNGGNGGAGSRRWIRALSGSQLCDLARGTLLALCWAGLAYINMSRMYHYIRGQSVLKLYVIFNMLQISDKLFCSFGEDILESLFASIVALAGPPGTTAAATSKGGKPTPGGSLAPTSKGVQFLHVVFHFSISALYVFGHSLLLFAQVITLNVSVNSDNSSLFVVLVSNNFIELKGAVFKRFDHHNLMQISAADIVERFQLTVFLLVIIVQNLAHLGLVAARGGADWLEKAGWMCFMVLGGEWGVDWIKHGFITKFNGIPPVVYRHFSKVLCTDFIHMHRHKTESSIHSVSRRLGLPSLPIAVLVVRVASQSFVHSPTPWALKAALALVGFVCLLLLKGLLTVVLLGHAARRVVQEPMERERAEAFAAALAAPAHQHIRAKLTSPSPSSAKTLILPRSPRSHAVAMQQPISSAAAPPTLVMPHPVHVVAASSFGSNSNNDANRDGKSFLAAPAASSTACSPSLFGLKEPRAAAGTLLSSASSSASAIGVPSYSSTMLLLSPLAAEGTAKVAAVNAADGDGSAGGSSVGSVASSEVVSRSTTPRDASVTAAPTKPDAELFALPPPAVPSSVSTNNGDGRSSYSSSPSSTAATTSSSSPAPPDDDDDSESLDTVAVLESDAITARVPLSVSIDAPSARGAHLLADTDGSLTARFGRLRTPTALERCNSNMSPQPPVTPVNDTATPVAATEVTATAPGLNNANTNNATTTVIRTVHVQVDGAGQVVHYAPSTVVPSATSGAAVTSPLLMSSSSALAVMQEGGQLHVDSAGSSGASNSTIAVYHSPQLRSDGSGSATLMAGDSSSLSGGTSILTTAAPPGSNGASASVVLAEGVAGLDVHIYHHHVPQTPQQLPLHPSQAGGHPTLTLGSPGSAASAADEITPGTGTAAVPAAVGALAPTTLVTINTTNNSTTTTTTTAATGAPAPAAASAAAGAGASSAPAAPKEKSGPQYEDAAKMEQDLLTVERYKISAGKAIPV